MLATFGLMLFFNEMVRIIWGATALYTQVPDFLAGQVELLPGAPYPAYRLATKVPVKCQSPVKPLKGPPTTWLVQFRT